MKKYFVQMNGISEFDILHKKYLHCPSETQFNLNEFKTYKAAKKFIIDHMEFDVRELKASIKEWKKK